MNKAVVRASIAASLLPLLLAASGCAGVQSVLAPSGTEAASIDPLLWAASWIGILVTLLVTVIVAVALYGPVPWRRRLAHEWLIIGGGIAFPVVVLTGLFIYGLLLMQATSLRSAEAGEPMVTVTGKLWWWEVVYRTPDGQEVVTANELRLPVGRPVKIALESDNVIHSFWVPKLAGKLDMIPGRTNSIVLQANEPGVSRGQCAEYCGGAHAIMAFYVVAMPETEFEAWIQREASTARPPATEEEQLGQQLFLANGCGGCHQVRGISADGRIGPDLTHVGSRLSLGAAALPNDRAAFARWIRDNQHMKPDNLMPPFRQFSEEELNAVSAYLDSLE